MLSITFGRERRAAIASLLLALASTPVAAQVSPLQPGAPPADREAQSPPDERTRLVEQLRALSEATEEWSARAAEYQAAWEEAPTRLREIEQDIEGISKRSEQLPDAAMTLTQLEAELAVADQHLLEAQRTARELEAEAARRTERRRQVPTLLSKTRERLREVEEAAAVAPSAPTAPPPTVSTLEEGLGAGADANADASMVDPAQLDLASLRARVTAQRRLALSAELEAYENELASYDARGALLARRRDRATQAQAYYGALINDLRVAIKRAQRRELSRQSEETQRVLARVDDFSPEVAAVARELAGQNAALAELWVGKEGLLDKVDVVTERLDRARVTLSRVETDLATLTAKVDAVGLADSVGALMRRERAEVPDVGMYRRFVRMRKEQIGAAQLQQIRLQERREELADIDARVQRTLEGFSKPLSEAERAEVVPLLRTLYEHQREYMDALVADYETYFQRLVDFDAEQRALIERSEELIDFIDRHVLWMPSGAPLDARVWQGLREGVHWLATPRFWEQARVATVQLVHHHALSVFALLLTGVAVLALVVRRRRRAQQGVGQRVAPAPTSPLRSLGLSFVHALWFPVVLVMFGVVLGASPDATAFVRSLAYGVSVAGAYWATLNLASWAFEPKGWADAHAGWHAPALRQVRRQLVWLRWTSVPAVALIFMVERLADDVVRESLGRVVFLLAIAPTVVCSHLLLRPAGPWADLMRRRRGSAGRPLVLRAIHLAATLGPIVLGGAAATGFYWTALQIAVRQHLTVVFLFALLLSTDTVRLWMRRAEHKLAVDRAQRKAAQAAEARAGSELRESTTAAATTEQEVDLAIVSRQTSRLTFLLAFTLGLLGLSAIWADLLPAAGILHQVELWEITQEVAGATQGEGGAARVELVPVTLADLTTALLIGLVALLLLRNLPGLFEVTLFRRFQAGERYAFATIVKYVIALTGAMFAFDAIGIGWANVQWLVAAVGLGLGFGLQEIFANFVSGLIILLERPVRVGDIVTVDGVMGTVTRIRTRATWITAFDRRELVVPNKEFVTSRLVNWSLSDGVVRVDVPVGIAYGSDVEKALAILREVAVENRRTLKDPPHQVFFMNFGDSSLGLELRVYIAEPDGRVSMRHELHTAIDAAFRKAGIEIAFPQTDLHVRSLPADWSPAAGERNDLRARVEGRASAGDTPSKPPPEPPKRRPAKRAAPRP